MLLRKETLDKIKSGEITVVFRKWKRPTVKAGGTLKTRIGVLNIESVDAIAEDEITDENLRAAGWQDLANLKNTLASRAGQLYRVQVAFGGADPRIALRRNTDLSPEEITTITGKLDGFDRRSKHGPWAFRILELIRDHPGEVSTSLAERMDVDRFWLKGNIRKLKALGLTISLEVGYQLSPRGTAYLAQIKSDKSNP
ncbi:MAG: hypothetical protein R3301_15445 [Saprospiraceae bacterium]|nr:hypothetical protein [Saprospiraceae bacterium]